MNLYILDRDNLDNAMFLKTFAESIQKINPGKSIIIHGDSAYTDRIVQTGLMRETAIQRSIRDLNHRLVTFFADYGIACIGLNGFQKEIIQYDQGDIQIKVHEIDRMPEKTVIVLSSLAHNKSDHSFIPLSLVDLITSLTKHFDIKSIFSFTTLSKLHFSVDQSKKSDFFLNKEDKFPLIEKLGYPIDLIELKVPHGLHKPLFLKTINNFQQICFFQNHE